MNEEEGLKLTPKYFQPGWKTKADQPRWSRREPEKYLGYSRREHEKQPALGLLFPLATFVSCFPALGPGY